MQALRAAQVYDGTGFLGAGTLVVDGERSVGVEPGHPELPADIDVTTYAGTLLPGLVDCHVHLVSNGDLGALERAGAATDAELDAQIRASLAASAAMGVTTVMDLGDRRYRTLGVRDPARFASSASVGAALDGSGRALPLPLRGGCRRGRRARAGRAACRARG